MRICHLTAAAMIVVSLATGGAAASDPAHGYWLTENGKAIVHFEPCGDRTCGRMVWVANPLDQDGMPKRDARNQQICGLQLVGGMEPAGHGAWQDGWIYNPKNGQRYSADVAAMSETQLKVRGYLGFRFLGTSQIWTRVEDDRGGCRV